MFAATHTYLHSGTYTVKVTVYDKKGRTTTKEVNVVLSSSNKQSKSKIFENLLLNQDFSQHKVSTDPDNPYRDAFSEWDISAITEVPGGEDGPYPRWIWGPRYPSCSYNGLLIDSPNPSIAYFQQSFFLPQTSTATLQISIRRCIGPCEIKILLTDDSTTHLIDIINTSKGLAEWYGNSKTYSYDISRYSGQDLTLRFEQTSPVWNWSCVLYSEISIAAELLERGSNPLLVDTYGDRINDNEDVYPLDKDNDGIPDAEDGTIEFSSDIGITHFPYPKIF